MLYVRYARTQQRLNMQKFMKRVVHDHNYGFNFSNARGSIEVDTVSFRRWFSTVKKGPGTICCTKTGKTLSTSIKNSNWSCSSTPLQGILF